MSGGAGGHLALTPWRAWVRRPLARSGGGVRRITCLVLALTSVRTVWAGECTVPPIASLGYACRGPCSVSLGPAGQVYVADNLAHTIVVFDRQHQFRSTIGGQGKQPGAPAWVDRVDTRNW